MDMIVFGLWNCSRSISVGYLERSPGKYHLERRTRVRRVSRAQSRAVDRGDIFWNYTFVVSKSVSYLEGGLEGCHLVR